MPADYNDSSNRHWEDAEYLYADNRLANADQLFGLSAECALKAVMKGLGMSLSPAGSPQKQQHRVHINNLWDEFIAFVQSRNGAKYANIAAANSNPFHDWDVAQRYYHRSDINQQNVDNHKQGALTARQVFQLAILDGVA
ncbi:MAG: hypothetical protein AB1656_09900 [Candidatus Omnitrophota bacterium]